MGLLAGEGLSGRGFGGHLVRLGINARLRCLRRDDWFERNKQSMFKCLEISREIATDSKPLHPSQFKLTAVLDASICVSPTLACALYLGNSLSRVLQEKMLLIAALQRRRPVWLFAFSINSHATGKWMTSPQFHSCWKFRSRQKMRKTVTYPLCVFQPFSKWCLARIFKHWYDC